MWKVYWTLTLDGKPVENFKLYPGDEDGRDQALMCLSSIIDSIHTLGLGLLLVEADCIFIGDK